MSRYTYTRENGNHVAYGFDHECGYFYQEFDVNGDCIIDKDSLFNKLKGYDLARFVEKNNYNENLQEQIRSMNLDLPF